jgi:hypothetical protein
MIAAVIKARINRLLSWSLQGQITVFIQRAGCSAATSVYLRSQIRRLISLLGTASSLPCGTGRNHLHLTGHCTRLYKRLGLRDYARLDFRAGADFQPRLLDVNPNPTCMPLPAWP